MCEWNAQSIFIFKIFKFSNFQIKINYGKGISKGKAEEA